MAIIDALLNSLNSDAPVRSILVGVHWTVVCSHHCGMAGTPMTSHPHGHIQVREAGHLQQMSARKLTELARSDEPLEAGIGLAAINSMLDVAFSAPQEINAFKVLSDLGQGNKVALIGRFPFVEQLRRTTQQLWVIEKNPIEGEHPFQSAMDLLPQADLVAITGSTLVNHTLDDLLGLCPTKATIMVLGPTTPLSPILFDYGVDILSGVRVVDEQAVLRTVGQGASFQQVEGVKLITVVHKKSK